jgi:hypothetical protein
MRYYIQVSVIECDENVQVEKGQAIEKTAAAVYVRTSDEASDLANILSHTLTGIQKLTTLRDLDSK